MDDIKGIDYFREELFWVGALAQKLQDKANNDGLYHILASLIVELEKGHKDLSQFSQGFQDGMTDAENMRNNIDICEGIDKENYKKLSFPMPLDKILNKMMEIAEIFNTIDDEADGNFKNDMKELYKEHHNLFVKIHNYQEKLKQDKIVDEDFEYEFQDIEIKFRPKDE